MQNLPFDHLFCNFIPGEDLSGKLDTLVIEHAELSRRGALPHAVAVQRNLSHAKRRAVAASRAHRAVRSSARGAASALS